MKISVIVPVARDRRLVHCLHGLFRQTVEPDAYEVLVVDNDPNDEIRRLVTGFPARYLSCPGGGSYAARNRGIEEARGEVLAFTDADAVPPREWLAVIGSVFERNLCDIACGPSYALNGDAVGCLVQMIDEDRWARLQREGWVNYSDTRNLAGRRHVFCEEPFNPSFRHAGDLEWGFRVTQRGHRILFVPEMSVGHDNVSSLWAVLRRGVRRGRGVAAVYQQHGPQVGISGARPLQPLGIDIKTRVLTTLTHPAIRPVAVAGTILGTALLASVIGFLLVAPTRPSRLHRLFSLFDRLTLLLGRLLGP